MNFNHVAPFGGGDMRGTNSKSTFLRLKEGARELKSENSQKAHLRHLLNPHSKFQPSTSIWRGVGREINSKNKKTAQKTTFLGLKEGAMSVKSLISKNHIHVPDQVCIPNFNFLA